MSGERDVVTIKKDGTTETGALTQEQVEATMTREQKKALRARVLERGIVVDRTTVELPPHLHGEWVHRDQIEIDRKRALGFWIDGEGGRDQYCKIQRSLHSDGTKVPMVGDVIFMITTKENKEMIDEINQDNFQRMHGKPGETAVKTQKEERDYRNLVEMSHTPTPVIEESKAREVQRAELETILKKE
jgi:hypothetical protein